MLKDLRRVMSLPPAPAPEPAGPVDPPFFHEKIAVLPFTNETADLEADGYLRPKLVELLAARGYPLADLVATDRSLGERGVHEGGHLRALAPSRLAAELGVERLLYGNIEEYRVINLGIYFRKEVKVSLKLVDREGKELWSGTGHAMSQAFAKPREAVVRFVLRLAGTQIEKIARTYLKAEADEAAWRALETLPQRALIERPAGVNALPSRAE